MRRLLYLFTRPITIVLLLVAGEIVHLVFDQRAADCYAEVVHRGYRLAVGEKRTRTQPAHPVELINAAMDLVCTRLEVHIRHSAAGPSCRSSHGSASLQAPSVWTIRPSRTVSFKSSHTQPQTVQAKSSKSCGGLGEIVAMRSAIVPITPYLVLSTEYLDFQTFSFSVLNTKY